MGRTWRVAVGFLTRLPVGPIDVADDDLARARAWFPAVGLLVGGLAAVALWLTGLALGPVVAAVVAVGVGLAATGAFHEDGLADTFDGLWGGWDVPQRLEIMRDSRLGTYGAAALTVSLLLRVGLLTSAGLDGAVRALVVGHVVGRASSSLMVSRLEPLREDGRGVEVYGRMGRRGAAIATTVTVAVVVTAVGVWSWAVITAAAAAYTAFESIVRRRLGGVTGDVLGATNQVVHIAVMAAVVGLARQEVDWWAL